MTTTSIPGYHTMDQDFVAFGRSPSPPATTSNSPAPSSTAGSSKQAQNQVQNAKAGPSRSKSSGAGLPADTPKGPKGKKRPRGREDEGPGPRNLKEEKKARDRSAPWCEYVEWSDCRDPAEMLNKEISAFYRHMSPTKEEFEVRFLTIEQITRAIHSIWPTADVTPFGSWQTQLYLPHGDIDLVVTKPFTESNKVKTLSDMARAIRQSKIADTVAIIAKARVPIIKFVTNVGKLNVDISLNQVNGIAAGKIVNQYLDMLPGARQMILVVKAFLSQRSMNEVYTGGLGSYSVICLVISFLQIHPKLRRNEIDPEQNLGTLLMEFFELYGKNFNYDEVGISIRRGGFYYGKRSRGWYRGGQAYLLSVEDPQDPDNDISGGSFGIRQVKLTLNGAFNILQEKLCLRAKDMTTDEDWYKAAEDDPEELSLLSAVMGVTRETTKHRQELHRLHREGRLQRLLGISPDIPFAEQFPEGQELRDASALDRATRKTIPPSSSNGRKHRKDDTPRRKGRHESPALQAIVVDDDEVGDFDDSSDDMYDQDQSHDFDANETFSEGSDNSDIEEIFPKIFNKVKNMKTKTEKSKAKGKDRGDRFQSVSVDSSESGDGIELLSQDEEEETRYNIKQKSKAKSVETSKVNSEEEDGEIKEDSPKPKLKPSDGLSKKQRREKNAARKAFWDAKGVPEQEEETDEGDTLAMIE